MIETKEACHACKGTGKQRLTVTTYLKDGPPTVEVSKVTCIDCDGDGIEKHKVWLEDTISWCQCGDRWTYGSYPGDGQCKCGVHTEHVHCGTCGLISQLG